MLVPALVILSSTVPVGFSARAPDAWAAFGRTVIRIRGARPTLTTAGTLMLQEVRTPAV
jgi:hypothetical protein